MVLVSKAYRGVQRSFDIFSIEPECSKPKAWEEGPERAVLLVRVEYLGLLIVLTLKGLRQ